MFSSYYMDARGHVYPNKRNQDDVRVVVISPEDREQVERLTRAYWRTDNDVPTTAGIDNMQAALREFADPTPTEVFEHFVISSGVDRLADHHGKREPLRALCGKRWTPDDNTVATRRCPTCEGIAEAGWTK